jgi:hypothetical protein
VISNCSLVSSRPAFPLHRLLNNVMRSVKARAREGGASNSISRSSGLVSRSGLCPAEVRLGEIRQRLCGGQRRSDSLAMSEQWPLRVGSTWL